MDLIILLPVFAAVTIGGLSNVFGAALGALLLSLAQNFAIAVDFGSLPRTRSVVHTQPVPRLHRGARHGRRADPQAGERPAGDGLSA